MVDIVKLDAALAYIDEHPDRWRQGTWGTRTRCGTALCLAGTVGVIDGALITWHPDDVVEGYATLGLIDGKEPWQYAEDALGLTEQQGNVLFAGGNSRADLQDMRDALAADAHDTLEDFEEDD
jgi:hypothetical protein